MSWVRTADGGTDTFHRRQPILHHIDARMPNVRTCYKLTKVFRGYALDRRRVASIISRSTETSPVFVPFFTSSEPVDDEAQQLHYNKCTSTVNQSLLPLQSVAKNGEKRRLLQMRWETLKVHASSDREVIRYRAGWRSLWEALRLDLFSSGFPGESLSPLRISSLMHWIALLTKSVHEYKQCE